MHLGKFDSHTLKQTLHPIYHQLCIQNRVKLTSRKLRIYFQHLKYSFKEGTLFFFEKLAFLVQHRARFSVLETVVRGGDPTALSTANSLIVRPRTLKCDRECVRMRACRSARVGGQFVIAGICRRLDGSHGFMRTASKPNGNLRFRVS